jgi:hypothetical protein
VGRWDGCVAREMGRVGVCLEVQGSEGIVFGSVATEGSGSVKSSPSRVAQELGDTEMMKGPQVFFSARVPPLRMDAIGRGSDHEKTPSLT